MDRFEAMSLLVDAVETGSLSAAARRVGAPLATVSRKVAELERRLGVRLLVRSTRRLSLTDAGTGYVTAAKRILDDVDEAERAAAGEYREPRGGLVVTAPVVFGRLHVLPVVTEFLAAYPKVDIRLALGDRSVDLVGDRIDAAVRIGPLADSSLVAMRLGKVRQVVCASPTYLAKRGVPQTIRALAGHDCVVFDGLSSATEWAFREGKRDAAAPIHARLVVSTAEAAIDAATSGAGLTRVLSYQAAPAVRSGLLELVLRDAEPEAWPVHLLHANRELTPLKLRAFLDFAAPGLRKRLSQVQDI